MIYHVLLIRLDDGRWQLEVHWGTNVYPSIGSWEDIMIKLAQITRERPQ